MGPFMMMAWSFAQPYAASVVRHGLTAGAVYLASKGLPMLGDGTMNDLAAFGMGAIGLAWSAIQKYVTVSAPVAAK